MVEHVERLFYSTGQVATQLGVSLATVRLLCENRVIGAEMTPGGQWRVPASEVERLKRDGLPMVPRPLPIEAAPNEEPEPATEVSVEVLSAQDSVAIARSTLEKRRIDREIEENEEWFRDRQRQHQAAVVLERQKADAQLAAQWRQQWMHKWKKYALDSVPYAARNEVELEVHAAVTSALSVLHASDPEAITKRLVDAAVRKALRPWQRKQDVQHALKSAMNRLPWDVQNKPEWAGLKKIAWDAAAEAVGKLHEEATHREMADVAEQAVQPVIRLFEHAQTCERIATWVYVLGATAEEAEAAKESVRKALLALPVGTASPELEKAKETALAPHKAAVAQRKETARLESEKQARRRAAECRVNGQLHHIERYLDQEYEFDGGYAELRAEANRLRLPIWKALIEEILKDPGMSDDAIRNQIERHIDRD